MNSTFIIQPTEIETEEAELYLELKRQGLSYIIIQDGHCLALATFHFKSLLSDQDIEREIHQLLDDNPLLLKQYKQVYIIYGYPQSLWVPHEFMTGTTNEAIMELVFGDTKETVLNTDYIEGHMIHNIYSVPAVIHSSITRYFEKATFVHLHSLLPCVIRDEPTYLFCIFDTGQLTVIVQKEGRLQVVQNFAYKTPDDVAYYLLKICSSFEIDVKLAPLFLSGMIDVESSLYTELLKYFLNLNFQPLPPEFHYPADINNYPLHYFSHLFAVAACV